MEILGSKRFISAIIGIIALVLTNISPEIGRLFADIQEGVVAIIVTLIAAYGAQDAVKAWKGTPSEG